MSARLLRQRVGELLVASFEGVELPGEIRSIAREFGLGGAILFRRNVEEPAQVAELSRSVQELTRGRGWVAVDQEGGRVARLREPFTIWPPMRTLATPAPAAGVALAERFAAALASELAAVGVTLDFAPVLDIDTNPANPVIGDRAFSSEPDRVAELGSAVVRGLQRRGVAACGKHFPGHGDTVVDSHVGLPVVEHPLERLRDRELVPFRAAIDAGVASLMTGHLLYPALDDERPATFSPRIIGDLLRSELGFDGVLWTDDLDMAAAGTDGDRIGHAAVRAILAGCDGLLICQGHYDRQVEALEALVRALESEELPASRVEEALRRHTDMKIRFARSLAAPPLTGARLRAAVGTTDHRSLADELQRLGTPA